MVTARPSLAFPTSNPIDLNPANFPEQDTPLAQASVRLQQVWVPYGVSIIPSRHVFDHMQAPPQVVNKTNGTLPDGQVQQMGLAYYRTGALWGWADAHDEIKFQVYLSNQGYLNTAAGQAESAGEPVTDPPCASYPVKLAVVPVDPAITSFEAGIGYTVNSRYALVEEYGGSVSAPCRQTANSPSGPVVTWLGPAVNVETGSVHNDTVLGLTWFGESDRTCPSGPTGLPSGFGTIPPAPGTTQPPEPSACTVFG